MAIERHDETVLQAALERLFSLQTFGIKLGLEPTRQLLAEIGDPQQRFPAIHIAGTNGKGSVAAMIASILQAAGHRVGLYTSPHLVHFDERIRINGTPIAHDVLARYALDMLPLIERIGCTFFEGTTAIGLRAFADAAVDVAVIETGMGGRLDATNILDPLVSVITTIGYDHTKHLGTTLEQIAFEKAGIIKPERPAVVGTVAPRLRATFAARAAEVNAPIAFVDDATHAIHRSIDEHGTTASFVIDGRELDDVRIDLIGRYQVGNARTALLAVETLRERFGLTDDIVRRGLGTIRASTGIRGRFEIVRRAPHVILDVAHNADGARVLVATLQSLFGSGLRARFVFGAVEDKDVTAIAEIFAPIAAHLYAVRALSERALPVEEIAHHTRLAGIETTPAGGVGAGIDRALEDAAREGADPAVIVVCGSFFVVADALKALADDAEEPPPVVREPARATPLRYMKFEETDDEIVPEVIENIGASETDIERQTESETSPHDQPRERLMQHGARALSDAELLAILLRTGRRGVDAVQVARTILNRFGDLVRLSARDFRELEEISGVGPTKAVTLAAAFELGRRMINTPQAQWPRIVTAEDIARMFIPRLRGLQKEQFHVVVLNTAGRAIRTELVSEGSLNLAVVHPREVYRTAIIERAAAIICVHNHPSGNPTPSTYDVELTRQLKSAGKVIAIELSDHIIVGGNSYVSMQAKGLM